MQLMQKRLYFLNKILFIIQLLIKNFIINIIYLIKYALQQSIKLVSLFHRNEIALSTKGNTNMTTLNNITFGLNVVTKYSNGKITATMKHGNDIKTTVRMSYDHSLSTGENHYTACLLCLEKVKKQDEKGFSVLSYSYNEKDDGYSFTCKRTV